MLLKNQMSAGQFDFQLRLDVTGNIYMLYKSVPLPIDDVSMRYFIFNFLDIASLFAGLSTVCLNFGLECRCCANYPYY